MGGSENSGEQLTTAANGKVVSPGRVLGARSASPAKRSAADMEGVEQGGAGRSGQAVAGSFNTRQEGLSDFDEAMSGMTPMGGGDGNGETQDTEANSMDTSADGSSATKSSAATSFGSETPPPPYEASPSKIRSGADFSAEDIDKQEMEVHQKGRKDLEEGQKGVVVSNNWLQRVLSRSSAGLKNSEFPKEAREGPIGPVDNSDILPDDAFTDPVLHDIEGRLFIPLKPGMTMGQDFEVFNDEAWGVVVAHYGLQHGQKQIDRYVRNTAGDHAATLHLQYELYPPIFKIRKVLQPKLDDGEEEEEEEEAIVVANSVVKLTKKREQLGRGQMLPEDVVQLVSSRQEKFQKFLLRSKEAAGIKRGTKVRVLKMLDSAGGAMEGTALEAATRTAAPGSEQKLVVSMDAFAKMEPGKDFEYIDAKDETNNPNYNGSSNMETFVLTESATLLLEEQIGGPAGGEFVSDKKKTMNKLNLSLKKPNAGSKSSSATTSGRTSPAPGASGMITRGRTRRDGRTRGTVGLNNLGNTCYMNSALQCIRSCEELAIYFLSQSYKADINASNPLGHGGAMAKQYANLLAQMYSDNNTSSVSPQAFKRTLGNFAPMFSGYGQQDSQEFLSFLVDALHEDLNRVLKKPYNENPDSNDETHKDPKKIVELGEIYRANHRARNDSVAMDLFSGFYKNTMECPTCDKISITFDPFSLLTVQLPNEGSFQHTVTFIPLAGTPINHAIDCDKGVTIKMLKEHVASKHPGVQPDRLWMVEIYNHKLYKVFENSSVLAESSIQSNDRLFIFELDGVPTNLPAVEKKSYSSSYLFSSNRGAEEAVPGMDDPRADCFAVPVFSRQKGRVAGWDIVLHPFYVFLTREEAKQDEVVWKKVLEGVGRLTSRGVLREMERAAYKDGKGEVKVEGEGAATALVSDTSGSEDGYVNVSLTGTAGVGKGAATEMRDGGVEVGAEDRRLPDGFMEPGYILPRAMHESLFTLGYAPSADSNMHCASMSSIRDSVRNLSERVKKMSRRGSAQSEGSGSETGSEAEEAEENDDDDDDDSGVFEMDTPDLVLGDASGMEESLSLPAKEEGFEGSGDESMAEDGLDGQHPTSRKGRRKKGKKNRRGKGRHGGRNKGAFNNSHNDRFNGSSAARKLNQSPPHDEDNPYYIKLGEALVLDWNFEALDALFHGDPRDADDLRGHFLSHPDGKDIPFLPDAELDAKKARKEARRRHGITLTECFAETGKREVLSEDNAWYCSRCKELRRATKTLEIWTCPDVLVVHLKRFGGTRSLRDKIDTLVDYPLEGLDMGGRVGLKEAGEEGEEGHVYDLFAVDNHYGGLGGGHYTAYARNFWDGEWYDYNDTHCTRIPESKVQSSAAAYLLFYRRRSANPLGPKYLQDLVNEFRNPSASADATADDLGDEESEAGEGRLGGPNGFSRGPSSAGTGAGVAGSRSSGDVSGGVGVGSSLRMKGMGTRDDDDDDGVVELDAGRPVFYGPERPPGMLQQGQYGNVGGGNWDFGTLQSGGEAQGQDGEAEDGSGNLIVSVETGGTMMDGVDADDDDAASTTAQIDADATSPYSQHDPFTDASEDPLLNSWTPSGGRGTPAEEGWDQFDSHAMYSAAHTNSDADLRALHLEEAGKTGPEGEPFGIMDDDGDVEMEMPVLSDAPPTPPLTGMKGHGKVD